MFNKIKEFFKIKPLDGAWLAKPKPEGRPSEQLPTIELNTTDITIDHLPLVYSGDGSQMYRANIGGEEYNSPYGHWDRYGRPEGHKSVQIYLPMFPCPVFDLWLELQRSKGKESRQSLLIGFSGRGAQYKNDEFENLLKEHVRRTYCFGAGLISVRASNRTMGLYRTALDMEMLEEMRILNKEW